MLFSFNENLPQEKQHVDRVFYKINGFLVTAHTIFLMRTFSNLCYVLLLL